MNKYLQIKEKNEKEFNNFKGVFFAFGKKQFEEAKEKYNISINNKIIDIGFGGYVLKSRIKEYNEMVKRHNNFYEEIKKDKNLLEDAFYYELSNHEYIVTYDYTDTLEALNITYEELKTNTMIKNVLIAAKNKYLKSMEEFYNNGGLQ